MIGDSFVVNGITYTIKKELKMGEYRTITAINSKLNRLSKDIERVDDFVETSSQQLQEVCNFLESHLGLSQGDIDNMSMDDAVNVFKEAFVLSTSPDKEIKKT